MLRILATIWRAPKSTILGVAFSLAVGLLVLLNLVGLSYRGLRFLVNYEDSKVTITGCKKEFFELDQLSKEWHFTIDTDSMPYAISRVEPIKQTWIFAYDDRPEKDWCEMIGRTISVLRFDKLEVAIPYDGDKPNVYWRFIYVFSMESTENNAVYAIFAILAPLVAIVTAIIGVTYSSHKFWVVLKSIKREPSEKKAQFVIRYTGRVIRLTLVFALAFAFTFGLMLVVLRGMLYVESSNSLLTGVCALVSMGLVALGPALILHAVYWIRNTSEELVIWIRELLLIVTVLPLTYKIWLLLGSQSVEHLSSESLWDFMKECLWETLS
jgi:hypothetical protein